MKDRIFLDTNIICYAWNKAEPAKRKICEKILEKGFSGEINYTVSNQVLGEAFNASVTRIKMPVEKAAIIIGSIVGAEKIEKVNYDYNTVNRAAKNFKESGVPFWDALIVETMQENGITTIMTENERDFRGIRGIKIINPFK